MPNVNEGLEKVGDGGLDPNDPRDFETILEGKGVPKEAGEGELPSTDIRSGLTTEEPAQTRAPETGRFVAKETKQTPVAATAPAPVADTSQVDDPEVASFLAKYGNDPSAALKAAANAQSLIGRQGQENGELRERLANLEGQLQTVIATRQEAPAAPVLTPTQVDESAQGLIDAAGNYRDAATQAANLANKHGDERVYRSIMEQWQLEDPLSAMDFNTDFRIWQREQRTAADRPAEPEAPAWIAEQEEQYKVNGLAAALKVVASEFAPEDWTAVSEQFDAALETMPKHVLNMIDSTDAEARQDGVRLVVDRATLLASKAPAKAAQVVDPVEQQVPASVARKLAGAAVASSALKAPPARSDAPQTREEAIADFKRQIIETETTNVSSGLTYGPTP